MLKTSWVFFGFFLLRNSLHYISSLIITSCLLFELSLTIISSKKCFHGTPVCAVYPWFALDLFLLPYIYLYGKLGKKNKDIFSTNGAFVSSLSSCFFSFPPYAFEAQNTEQFSNTKFLCLIKIKLYAQSDNKSPKCKYSHLLNAARL